MSDTTTHRDYVRLRNEYYAKAGTRRLDHAAALFTRDLMRCDPSQFKSGYTLENALLSAQEVFGLPTGDMRRIGDMVANGFHFVHTVTVVFSSVEPLDDDAAESFSMAIEEHVGTRGFEVPSVVQFRSELTLDDAR